MVRLPALPLPALPLAAVTRTRHLAVTALLAVAPHGGQRTARRNAWAGMSAGAAVARARREADEALRAASAVGEARARAR